MEDESTMDLEFQKVESLKTLASMVKFEGEKTLIHKFVLDHSHPNKAASDGFLNAVMLALSNVARHVVNAHDGEGCTALHWAVRKNNLPMVQKLLSHVVHINIDATTDWYRRMPCWHCLSSYSGYGALHFAAKDGNITIAQELLLRGANVDLKNENKRTPLGVAAEEGHLDAMKLFVSAGAEVNLGLCAAAESGKLETLELLVSSGADVNFRNISERGETALCSASIGGHLVVVEYLVSKGADVNFESIFNSTALHCAARGGQLKIAECLVKNGAHVNAGDQRGETPLFVAAAHSDLEVIECLLRNGANVNARNDYGETPLHNAISEVRSVTVRLLIDRGADVNAQDQVNRTPLHTAVTRGESDIVEFLINRGADTNIQDRIKETPLHCAVKERNKTFLRFLRRIINKWESLDALGQKYLGIIKYLLDQGADFSTIGKEGQILVTPAFEECSKEEAILSKVCVRLAKHGSYWNWSKIIRVLLDGGADPSARNKKGETPIDLARNQECVDFLERYKKRNNF